MSPVTTAFLSGSLTMGFLVCALFFLRFWTKTRDGLFLAFSLAFLLLAIGQGLTALLGEVFEERSWLYLVRLSAFVVVIIAILRKNITR